MFVALSVRTLLMRRGLRIPIGDAGDKQMLRAMRVHANFAEYVPLCLLLILMAEMRGAASPLVHLLCISVLVGRLSHAYGVSRMPENFRYRVIGMALTFVALISSAMYLLKQAIGVYL